MTKSDAALTSFNKGFTCSAAVFSAFAKEAIHQSFPDPSAFTGSDEEIRAGFRRVRDEIIRWIDTTFRSTHA